MAVYALYKYDFRYAEQGNIMLPDGQRTPLDKAQEVLDELLKGNNPLPLSRIRQNAPKEEQTVVLANEVLFKLDGVTLMLLCNEKRHHYQERKEESELTYHPGCYVLVDNRKDIANIAIERTKAFENNPDKVRDLLQEALNKKLEEQGLQVSIRAKVREATVWQVVEDYTQRYNDPIRKVVFDFPVPGKVSGIDTTPAMRKNLAAISAIAAGIEGAKGSLKIEAEKEGALHIDQTQEDMAQMVRLCSSNAYDIQIHFKYHRIYRYGDFEKAMGNMDDHIIDDCLCGQLSAAEGSDTPVFRLIKWLDEIRGVIKDYNDEEKAVKKRKRRG